MFNRKINILVTGAKGQLGSYLVNYFKDKSFKEKSKIGKVFGIDIEDLDIRNASDVADFFNKNVVDPPVKLDYVIHCAAATDTAAIEEDPSKFYAVNCLGPKNIAQSCAYNKIKMIFISTDYVMSEFSGTYSWKLQEFPVNQYGLQKLIAEQFVKEAYKDKPKDCMILRSSWMFGNSDKSFVEKFLANAFKMYAANTHEKKIEVPVANDAYGRPTPTWFIADTIEHLILNNMHGTIDLQYPFKQISRYDWAKMIWNAFVSDRCMDSKMSTLVNALKDSIEVVPKSSAEIGVQMHHPGKVGDGIGLEDGRHTYAQDTMDYMHKNWQKLIKIANSIINGAK